MNGRPHSLLAPNQTARAASGDFVLVSGLIAAQAGTVIALSRQAPYPQGRHYAHTAAPLSARPWRT